MVYMGYLSLDTKFKGPPVSDRQEIQDELKMYDWLRGNFCAIRNSAVILLTEIYWNL